MSKLETALLKETEEGESEWKRAVMNELKCAFEDREKDRREFEILRENNTGSIDYLTDTAGKIQADIIDIIETNKSLERRINALERENGKLIEKVEELEKQLEEIPIDIASREDVKRVKKYCIETVDEITAKFESDIKSLERKIKTRSSGGATSEYVIQAPSALPKFKGYMNERPMKFLKELERYVESMALDENQLKRKITQCLEGDALSWWHLHDEQVTNFETFSAKFKDMFWSKFVQREVKRRVDYGKFQEGGRKKSRKLFEHRVGKREGFKSRNRNARFHFANIRVL